MLWENVWDEQRKRNTFSDGEKPARLWNNKACSLLCMERNFGRIKRRQKNIHTSTKKNCVCSFTKSFFFLFRFCIEKKIDFHSSFNPNCFHYTKIWDNEFKNMILKLEFICDDRLWCCSLNIPIVTIESHFGVFS